MASVDSGKVPVLQTVSDSWRFAMDNIARLAPAAIILGVAITLVETLASGMPGVGAAFAPGGAAFMALDFLGGVLVRAFFAGVIFRLMMREEFSRPTGLQFGRDEVRLLGAQIGAALIYGPIAIAIVFGPAMLVSHSLIPDIARAQALMADPQAFADTLIDAFGSTGASLVMAVLLALVAAVLWVLLRLCLVQAASFAERRIVVLQTWGWTRGNLMRIAAAHILVYVPAMLAATIIVALIAGVAAPDDATASGAAIIAVRTLINVLSIIAEIPLIALMAILYRGLRPPAFQPR